MVSILVILTQHFSLPIKSQVSLLIIVLILGANRKKSRSWDKIGRRGVRFTDYDNSGQWKAMEKLRASRGAKEIKWIGPCLNNSPLIIMFYLITITLTYWAYFQNLCFVKTIIKSKWLQCKLSAHVYNHSLCMETWSFES